MKSPAEFPFRLHWTAQDLADAMPLRLSQISAFKASAGVRDNANDDRVDKPPRRELRCRYLPKGASLPLFRVHS